MAKFTRKEIREIIGEPCTEEMENRLMAMHLGVVDPMKDDIARYKADAEKLSEVQSELDAIKAKGDGGYKEKYEKERDDFKAYKADVERKASHDTKEAAVKAYLESKHITGANLKIAMRAVGNMIDGMELDGEKLAATDSLDELIKDGGDLAGLVVKTSTKGADTANPPANNGGKAMTRADLYKKDEHGRYIMSAQERQKALAENPDLMK